MISFDLRCGLGHVFEAWFRSSVAYEDQRVGGHISCPICGNSDVSKALMAPAVAAKGNRRAERPTSVSTSSAASTDTPAPSEAQVKALLGALAEAQSRMLEQSTWVGDQFADRARAIYYGDADAAPIHGTANIEETRAMLEEGLPVAPLLVPVAPPDETH